MNERIKRLRKALDLTQQQFADKLGIRQNTIAKYETNRGNPTTSVIALICREFNVSEEWLRTGTGEMFKPEDESVIDRLCEEMRASELEAGIIRAYFKIDPQIRDTFMRRLIQEASSSYPVPSPEAPAGKIVTPGYSSREELEAEARAEAEEYYREILEEKRRAANGSASGDTNASGTA